MDDSNNCAQDQNVSENVPLNQVTIIQEIDQQNSQDESQEDFKVSNSESNENQYIQQPLSSQREEEDKKKAVDTILNVGIRDQGHNNEQINNFEQNYVHSNKTSSQIAPNDQDSRQLSSIASFGQIGGLHKVQAQSLAPPNQDILILDGQNNLQVQNFSGYKVNQPMAANEPQISNQNINNFTIKIGASQQQKSSSQNKDLSGSCIESFNQFSQIQNNTNRQVSNMILQSPNHNIDNTLKPPSLFLSANSKKSTSNSGLGKIPNNFTMRSLKSQNSVGTGGSHTNRAESYLQKSPHTHMSDLQDPYAYFNMHQQKQSVNAPMPIMNRSSNKHMGQMSNEQDFRNIEKHNINYESANADSNHLKQIFGNQVKSCRTNLYGKQHMISQRGGVGMPMIGVQGKLIPQPQNILEIHKAQSSKHEVSSGGQEEGKCSKTMSDTQKLAQNYLSNAEEPFILNQNQIKFNNQSAFNNVSRKNSSFNKNDVPPTYLMNKHPVSAKTKFGIQKSGGSGSRGSNFNSSTSTFPAAPVSKLSDVKNPQKLMTFRFVNQKATKIQEITLFKNLQELDLSGNLLQEQVKELNQLSFLKRLCLCNNKITEMWTLPSSLEIVNLSFNLIKKLPITTCKKLKNVTTLDIQSNKLETLENFEHLQRLKRLLAKNNYIRGLDPLQSIKNIFEIDLEGNAVDSHIDFVKLIKGKNDLIVFNLHQNPLMVETETIEKFNDDLIQKAPQYVTQKSEQEIQDIMELLNTNPARNEKQSEQKGNETQRFCLHLVEELSETLSFLKNGVLYRNKRVFNKLKAVCQRQHRMASDISNYSHHDLSAKLIKAPFNQITQRKSKDIGSTQDKNSINLTPQSDHKKTYHDPSSQPREKAPKHTQISQSQMFSPVYNIKTKRYEDVENIYDYIVEQEELKRLKREKILAKRKQQKKKLIMSQIDDKGSNQSEFSDSENNSSQFSDDDIDDSDDLSMEDTHDLIEPRDDFEFEESCIIDQGSSQIIEYPNQRLHDDEVASQTFTSDLDADLHSYKKDGGDVSYNHEKIDDNDHLNGSTAGFGKKLREINREINHEDFQEDEDENIDMYSQQKQSIESNDSIKKVKLKGKFDLNLDQIKVNQKHKHLQSDLKKQGQNVGMDPTNGEYPIEVQQFNIQKTKTTQNSHENSQCEDGVQDGQNHAQNKNEEQNQLNQSFSIRNLQNQFFSNTNNENIEVESLMMNKQILAQPNGEGQVQRYPDIQEQQNVLESKGRNVIEPMETMAALDVKENLPEIENKNSQIVSNDSNQNIMLNTESMSFKFPQSKIQNINQSLNNSLLNNSMAQSIQSVTQTSKKTIIANFKLDLSKCKQDQVEDEYVNQFDDSKSVQTSKSQNLLSSIVKADNESSMNQSLNEDSKIKMEDIIFTYNDSVNIENMSIDVDRDSFRNNPSYNNQKLAIKSTKNKDQSNESVILGNKTERDPTPAPIKQRSLKRVPPSNQGGDENNKNTPPIAPPKQQQGCSNCKKLEQKINAVQALYSKELNDLKHQIQVYQDVFTKIKQNLNLSGEIDFNIRNGKEKQSKSQKKMIKLSNFANLVLIIFKRMYTDLEHQKYYNNNLELQIKNQQQQLSETVDKYNQVSNVINSLTNRSLVKSIDLTDQETPEASSISKKIGILKMNSNLNTQQTNEIIPKVTNKSAKITHEKLNKIKSKEKESLKIKMQDMQQAQISQLSESSFSENGEIDQQSERQKRPQSKTRGQSKKKSAKTVRTYPISSKEIKSIKKQNRVNSNPKITVQEKQANNQYVANTFSSNYSLSNPQKASMCIQAPMIVEEDQLLLPQESITEASGGLLLNQFSQNSQLHILPNSFQVKVLPNQAQISGDQNPIILQNNMINYQSNTSRSGGKMMTSKKVKSPVMHHVQKNFEQTPNNLNLSYSNKKQRMQKIEMLKDRDLGSEILSNQIHNYKTSRMPVTNSLAMIDLSYPHEMTADNDQILHQHLMNCENLLAENSSPQIELLLNENTPHQQFFSQQMNNSTQNFSGNYINSSQIKSEKRNKHINQQYVNNSMKQSFKTQRKMNQGRNLLNPASGVQSQRPVDNKTQRIQRQILNKSGATNIANIINLQQTYDHNIKKSSINAVIGLSNTATDSNSLQQTKRPQSVAERGNGRNMYSRKSQNKQYNVQQNSKQNMKSVNSKNQKGKYKSKSTERKNSRQGMTMNRDTVMSMKNNQQIKYSNARNDQQVNNLQVNIQKIQMLQNQKFNAQNSSVLSRQNESVTIVEAPKAKSKQGNSTVPQERPYSSRTSRFSD